MKALKSKFYNRASSLVRNGASADVIYSLENEYDITKQEIDAWLKIKKTSSAVAGAVGAGREEREMIYQIIDQKFIDQFPELVTFRRGDNVEFYEYDNGVYQSVGEQDMVERVDAVMAQYSLLDYRSVRRKVFDTVARIASALSRAPHRHFTEEQAERQRYRLNLKNGLLDTSTFQLSPHSKEYFSTIQVPYEYIPAAAAPDFMNFIRVISGNDETTARMIQEMFGYCIMEGNPNHKVFYLYGDTARNGKSTAAKILCGLIGWGSVSTLSLSQLAGETSSILTALVGKQVNFSDEISSKYIESSRLTAMSAEGVVEVNPKYKKSFMHKIRTKFIITCNDLPRFQDSQGMKHRMVSIPFRYHIPEKQRILRYDELLLEREGSGILNWAIEGAKILKQNGVFSINDASAEDVYDNLMQSNPTYAYLYLSYRFSDTYKEEFTMENLYGTDEKRKKEETVDATGFRLFCKEKGLYLPSFFVFCREVKRFARETGKIEQKKRTDDRRFYVGLKEKSDVLDQFNNF